MRGLSAEEQKLWAHFAREVRRLPGRSDPVRGLKESASPAPQSLGITKPETRLRQMAAPPPKPAQPRPHANTLDAGWDKRLAKGAVSPDRTIDLHGHTLSSAHAMLDIRLGEAVRSGARLVLLITGRPARDNPRLPPTSRGVIRASVTDWIAASGWASHIAAIRNAHPRHGGAGALYVVLRRGR